MIRFDDIDESKPEEEWIDNETTRKAFLTIVDWAFIKTEKGFDCVNIRNEKEHIFFEVKKYKPSLRGWEKYILRDIESTISGEKYWEVKFLAERNREFLFAEWEGKLLK